jgi:hypothetical protein
MQYRLRKARIIQIFGIQDNMIVELADEREDRWVLELRGVVGFSYQRNVEGLVAVQVSDLDSPPGAYAINLAAKLQSSVIRNYPAVYLMREPVCNEVVFSAVAQFTDWKRA